jgi:hypothetical protein
LVGLISYQTRLEMLDGVKRKHGNETIQSHTMVTKQVTRVRGPFSFYKPFNINHCVYRFLSCHIVVVVVVIGCRGRFDTIVQLAPQETLIHHTRRVVYNF